MVCSRWLFFHELALFSCTSNSDVIEAEHQEFVYHRKSQKKLAQEVFHRKNQVEEVKKTFPLF
jgi:hypothetical protein